MANKQSSDLLHNVYVFKELAPAELEKIAAVAKSATYNPGDEIFCQGDEAHALYVIKLGSVKIEHSGKKDAIAVANVGSGGHFGEMAFVDGDPRSATVIAVEKTDVVTIDFKDLKQVLDSNPAIAVKVYKAFAHFLCGRLRVTTTDLSFAREKNIKHF